MRSDKAPLDKDDEYILYNERVQYGNSTIKNRKFLPDDGQDLFEYLSQVEVVKYEPYHAFTREQGEQEAINRSNNPDF